MLRDGETPYSCAWSGALVDPVSGEVAETQEWADGVPPSTEFAPPSLRVVAARAIADNAAAVIGGSPAPLDALPEEEAAIVLNFLVRGLRLTVPLARAFQACRHPTLAAYVLANFDVYRAL